MAAGWRPSAVERVGPQVGQEDVGRLEQLFEPFPRLVLAQVEHHAALAAVVLGEGGVGDVAADPERTEGAPHRVTGRRLDLDHVHAPVGQQRSGGGGGHPHAELDDAQARQCGEALRVGSAHRVPPAALAAAGRATSPS